MSQHTSLTNTKAQTSHDGSTMLHGRWPLVAHMAWLIAVGITVGVAIAGLPQVYVLLQTVCTQEQNACTLGQLAAESANQLNALGLSLKAYALGYLLFTTAMTLVWWLVAAVIFWRKGNDWLALLVALTLVLQGANSVMELLYTRGGVYLFLSSLGYGLLALVLYLFPDGRFAPRWMRWVAMVLLGCLFVLYLLPASIRAVVDTPVAYGVLVSSIMVVQVYRYRQVSSAVERQQTKWVVFGVVVYASGIVGLVLFPSSPLNGLTDLVVGVAVPLFALFIPLSFGMAILRSRLWDIDIIIRRTLIYSVLTAILALVYAGSVLALHRLLAPLIEPSNDLVVVASTLAIVVLFGPLRRHIQRVIDRRFYRQKYDAATTLAAFSMRLREEIDLDPLCDDVVQVVQETLQPAHVSLWLVVPQQKR
jgi:hypothetical protein